MTPPIMPDHAPGVGWCIRDLERQATWHDAQSEWINATTIGQSLWHSERAEVLREIADGWRTQLEDK